VLERMSNRMVAALGCNRGDMVDEARAIPHKLTVITYYPLVI
jgi:hypothetical protein